MSDINSQKIASPEGVLDEAARAHLDSMHRLGRLGAVLAVIIMLGMPIIAGIYFHAMPGILRIISASIGLLSIFAPAAISEVIAYTPVFGSSIYLAQITGNISNLKLPVANTILQVLDVESGTEDADIVTSIAVSVSSFVTIVIIVVGVLLLIPLRPVLTLPAVKLASGYIVPALFGSMAFGMLNNNLGGGIKSKGRLKGAILPAVVVIAINLIVGRLLHLMMVVTLYQGFIMLLLLPITWFGTKWLYKKGQIKVYLPGEEPEK
ncbi:hypothetical protein FACS1894130_07050 [Spirochaetia bacterium]|nr:hypothetical protein FACS1894130_07050 [Spirochaetia bacterium]